MEPIDICSICHDETTERFSCGHHCHYNCMATRWKTSIGRLECTMCTKPLTRKDSVMIYKVLAIAKVLTIKDVSNGTIEIPQDCKNIFVTNTTNVTVIITGKCFRLDCTNNKSLRLEWKENATVERLLCTCNQLTELKVPRGIKTLNCTRNQLTELKVPEGIKTLNCSNNHLIELIVPEGIEELNCSHNQLAELKVPDGIKRLYCSFNRLSALKVHKGTKEIRCSYNQLTKLIVPEGIDSLDCSYNQLTDLEVPEGFENLNCSHNHMPEIDLGNTTEKTAS